MFGMGGSELLVIALVALLVFGPGRIPEVMRTVARGYKELSKLRQQMDSTVAELRQDIDLGSSLEERAPQPAPHTQPRPAQPPGSAPALPLAGTDSDDYLAADTSESAADEQAAPQPPARDRP